MNNSDEQTPKPIRGSSRYLTWKTGAAIAVIVLIAIAIWAIGAERQNTHDAAVTSQGDTIWVNAADRPKLIVSPDNLGYQPLLQYLGSDGSHTVRDDQWLKAMDILGYSTSTPQQEATLQAEERRWKERHVHHDNVNAFSEAIFAIAADDHIDQIELAEICLHRTRWETELTDAQNYVVNYHKDDPDLFNMDPGMRDLLKRAELGLAVIKDAADACPRRSIPDSQ